MARSKPRLSAAAIRERAQIIKHLRQLDLWTADETAFVVGCSASFVREACSTGKLPAMRIGSKQFRIRPADADAWLQASMPTTRRTLERVR